MEQAIKNSKKISSKFLQQKKKQEQLFEATEKRTVNGHRYMTMITRLFVERIRRYGDPEHTSSKTAPNTSDETLDGLRERFFAIK